MAKRISERVNVSYNKAMNITRTETHRNIESGFMDCAEHIQEGLEDSELIYAVTWRTMKDERVRPNQRRKTKKGWVTSKSKNGANHQKMENVTVKAGELFDLGGGVKAKAPSQTGVASHDCNCRCFLEYNLMTVDEFEKATGKKVKNGVEKDNESGIIKMSGALTSKNDPTYKKRDDFATSYYQEVKNRNKVYEIKAVAENTGLSKKFISKVYDHIFINKYELINGYKNFDPDYNIAQSWQRLREGKNIQPHDITLLKHEWLEYELMKKTGRNYSDAHNLTIRKYDYNKELMEYLNKYNLH